MDFNKLALDEAKKSLCKKRKVGAIIVIDNEIKARGHNYILDSKTCENIDGTTKDSVIHAEIAAINNLPLDSLKASKGTIYVTHTPCENCKKAIEKIGLKTIVVNEFMKFDSGKLQYNLIPPKTLKELAKVLTYGAKKYKPNNWKEVDNTDRYIDALYRHLEEWRAGNKIDEESGLSHLSHALANINFLLFFENDIK